MERTQQFFNQSFQYSVRHQGAYKTLSDLYRDCIDPDRWRENIGKKYDASTSYSDLSLAMCNLGMDEFEIFVQDIMKDGIDAISIQPYNSIATFSIRKDGKELYQFDIIG